MSKYSFSVPNDYSLNERLDVYISSLPEGITRSQLKSGCSDIKINGKNKKLSYKVCANDVIEFEWTNNIPCNIEGEDIPLDIIYEDENVCVINKKQGMVTHPACGNWTGTLVNALLFHWNKDSIQNVNSGDLKDILKKQRPGIVHRLDKDTSGIIITAKNSFTEEFLSSQFRNHKSLKKEYIAICMGCPAERSGVIKTRIVRDPNDRKKFKTSFDETKGKLAISYYKCIACYGDYSLFRVRILTGRTHQIRVHLKHINCPILGDEIYSRIDKKIPKAKLMLHAKILEIRIPNKPNPVRFKTKTPERFLEVIRVLKNSYKKS